MLAVYHPGHAELIGEHAEPHGPEGLRDRHLDRAVFGQGGKDALPNFSMQGTTLTYKMNKENVNLGDKAAAFVRQQLDK